MQKKFRNIIIRVLSFTNVEVFYRKIESIQAHLVARKIGLKIGSKFKFVPQGCGGISITGDLSKLFIASSSHLKSGTYIECSGGVYIGEYFHPGRNLTILSSNHDFRNSGKIPYDEKLLLAKVIIEDFVWVGLNVTILPGVRIGEGAILGAGSVVTKDVPKLAIAAGNPAAVKKFRDSNKFFQLKSEGQFY